MKIQVFFPVVTQHTGSSPWSGYAVYNVSMLMDCEEMESTQVHS
jgi:hypothetical protein